MLLLSVEDEDEDGLPLRVGWLQDWNKLLELIHEAKSTSFAGNPQFLEQSPSTAALNCCSQPLHCHEQLHASHSDFISDDLARLIQLENNILTRCDGTIPAQCAFAICALAVLTSVCCSYASQLQSDSAAVNIIGNSHCLAGVSLAAKWAPREGSTTDKKCSAVRKVRGTVRQLQLSVGVAALGVNVWRLSRQEDQIPAADCNCEQSHRDRGSEHVGPAMGQGEPWQLL